jgi:DNA-binding response OmpR family regulator
VRFIPMSRETIVILDPESNTQWPLKKFLENEDYNVISVSTIENARKKFSEFEVSGLITEYWIKHSSTLETIRGFKEAFPEAYVMLLTNGEIKENEYEEILNAGVDDFFLKPFPIKKILLHLRKGLRQRQNLLQKKRLADELKRLSPIRKFPG